MTSHPRALISYLEFKPSEDWVIDDDDDDEEEEDELSSPSPSTPPSTHPVSSSMNPLPVIGGEGGNDDRDGLLIKTTPKVKKRVQYQDYLISQQIFTHPSTSTTTPTTPPFPQMLTTTDNGHNVRSRQQSIISNNSYNNNTSHHLNNNYYFDNPPLNNNHNNNNNNNNNKLPRTRPPQQQQHPQSIFLTPIKRNNNGDGFNRDFEINNTDQHNNDPNIGNNNNNNNNHSSKNNHDSNYSIKNNHPSKSQSQTHLQLLTSQPSSPLHHNYGHYHNQHNISSPRHGGNNPSHYNNHNHHNNNNNNSSNEQQQQRVKFSTPIRHSMNHFTSVPHQQHPQHQHSQHSQYQQQHLKMKQQQHPTVFTQNKGNTKVVHHNNSRNENIDHSNNNDNDNNNSSSSSHIISLDFKPINNTNNPSQFRRVHFITSCNDEHGKQNVENDYVVFDDWEQDPSVLGTTESTNGHNNNNNHYKNKNNSPSSSETDQHYNNNDDRASDYHGDDVGSYYVSTNKEEEYHNGHDDDDDDEEEEEDDDNDINHYFLNLHNTINGEEDEEDDMVNPFEEDNEDEDENDEDEEGSDDDEGVDNNFDEFFIHTTSSDALQLFPLHLAIYRNQNLQSIRLMAQAFAVDLEIAKLEFQSQQRQQKEDQEQPSSQNHEQSPNNPKEQKDTNLIITSLDSEIHIPVDKEGDISLNNDDANNKDHNNLTIDITHDNNNNNDIQINNNVPIFIQPLSLMSPHDLTSVCVASPHHDLINLNLPSTPHNIQQLNTVTITTTATTPTAQAVPTTTTATTATSNQPTAFPTFSNNDFDWIPPEFPNLPYLYLVELLQSKDLSLFPYKPNLVNLLTSTTSFNVTPLHMTIVRHNMTIFNIILNLHDDVDITTTTHHNRTALGIATQLELYDCVERLLKFDQSTVNLLDIDKQPPLYWAILHHRHDIVKLLLSHGADVTIIDPLSLSTFLHYAVNTAISYQYDVPGTTGNTTITTTDNNNSTNNDESPTQFSHEVLSTPSKPSNSSSSSLSIRTTISHTPNQQKSLQYRNGLSTPIPVAITAAATTQTPAQIGQSTEQKDPKQSQLKQSSSPQETQSIKLYEYIDDPQICYYLISAGCAVDLPDADRRTPLYLAVKHKLTNSIHTILDFSPSIDILDDSDVPLFHWACLLNERSVVFRLLQINPEIVNIRTINGDYPIFWACERRDNALSIVKLLIECGAIFMEPSELDGLLPHERAQQCGNGIVADYLISIYHSLCQQYPQHQQLHDEYYQ